MLTTVKDIVLLCIRKIVPIMVIGAEIKDTNRSAVHNAIKSGFFTRAVVCEHNDISKVELPQMPLNTTMPYNMINISNDSELINSPFGSYRKLSFVALKLSCVDDGFVIIVTFRVAFFICDSFSSHCVFSILCSQAFTDLRLSEIGELLQVKRKRKLKVCN
jgi:hypothetical protein